MNIKNIFLLLIFAPLFSLWSQEFTVTTSTDMVYMGNYFQVSFTIENVDDGEFIAPDFGDFDIVGGPSQSTQISMINGETTQSKTYSYFLQPREAGIYTIGAAYYQIGSQSLETAPIEIIVEENPDGIRQNPNGLSQRDNSFFDFPDIDEMMRGMWDGFDFGFPDQERGLDDPRPPSDAPVQKNDPFRKYETKKL